MADKETQQTSTADSIAWHGSRGKPEWTRPACTVSTDVKARPKYTDIDASEYRDTDEVLEAKIQVLKAMIDASSHFLVYTGAGISTAAGIPDYASQAPGSSVKVEKKGSCLRMEPTYAHRVLAGLEKKGILKHWLQQNHDGLAQKAGFPFVKLNEIHGAWFDRTNPVVKMSGSLRSDLFAWMEEWSDKADLVLAMGTSLSGMNADQVASRASEKHFEGTGQGLVIVNLQRTQLDTEAQLRIFAPLDVVMKKLATLYQVKVDTIVHSPTATPKDMEEVRRRAKRLGVKVTF